MREGWKSMRLTDFVWFQRGFDLPRVDFIEGTVPVYGSTSVLGYHNIAKVKAPGIITGRSGTLGKFQFATEDFWPHNTSLWVKDFKKNDELFAFYLLQTLDFTIFNSGGAVPTLNRNLLNAYIVNVPPLETQRKIASILSGYDDLIENNLKRIKILEEMAQQTYEEWFVRMRFPGYETAVMNEETGLPEGWEKKVLRDLGNIITGKTPSTTNELFYNGDIPFIKTPDMNNSIYVIETNQNLTEAGSNNQKGKLICKNSLVVSCIGSAGVYSLVSKPSQFNQQINAITFNSEEYIYFTYGFVKGLKEKLEALGSNGATMTNVNKTKFEQIEIIIPNEDLLNNFHNKVKNNFESILNLQSQNQRLRESRDILLPRLMMGMIEV
jgi:type I restriction enzyme S subunit